MTQKIGVLGKTMELNREFQDFIVEKAHELLRQPIEKGKGRMLNVVVENIYTIPQSTQLNVALGIIESRLPGGVKVYDIGGTRIFVVRSESGGINIGKYSFTLYVPDDLRG